MTTKPTGTLVLASASEARRRMLANAGIDAVHTVADVDEAEIKDRELASGRPVATIAKALAEAKAHAVSRKRAGDWIIGADQILECDGRLYDKPSSRAGARETLVALRDREHRLVSAAAIVRDNELVWGTVDIASLTMRWCSDAFLDTYLDAIGDDATVTVGAYRLEGQGVQLFSRIEGDVFTILGLPLLPLMQVLQREGLLAT